MSAKAKLRSALRPLIPDALMARYRRRQHSRSVRTNVDIYVPDGRLARRWRSYTPDTYRIVTFEPTTGPPDHVVIGEIDDSPVPYLGFLGSEVVVSGAVNRPRMRGMRITEPMVQPRTIVTTDALLRAVGVPDGADPATALRMFRDGGSRIGLLPSIVGRPITTGLPITAREAVVVMAAVPLHDIGGGSRAAQITFELLRRGYHVAYVYQFPSSEGVDLGLRYPHPRLEEYQLENFDSADLTARTTAGLVIVEAPIGEFIPPIRHLKDAGWSVLYDVIDDWTDQSLGGMWYAPVFEEQIVDLADAFTASAPDLVDRIASFGHEAALIPNAVNESVFAATGGGERPDDLPTGPIIGYHGSLYGEWLDWVGLRSVAEAFRDHTIVIIGDDHGIAHNLPDNVLFLGLKPQADLPAYLREFDAGLVPFLVTPVTHAVSPLKVYEYLACGVPVAAPPLRSLEGLEGVAIDADLVVAVREALEAQRPFGDDALRMHSWSARLDAMMRACGRDLRPLEEPDVRVLRRVPVRYAKDERLVRS